MIQPPDTVMLDSSTLIWLFVLITLIPGGALLIGDRISPHLRVGLLLAGSGMWLALASVAGTAVVASRWLGVSI